jgi:peptidoglycan/LPS O-acetylase OafA/YrhL
LVFYYYFRHPFGSFYFWYAPVWVFGALVAGLRGQFGAHWIRWTFATVVLIAAGMIVRFVLKFGSDCFSPANEKMGASLVHACLAVVCVASLHCMRWECSSRVGKLLSWCAGYSYTLYVIHFPLLLLSMAVARPVFARSPLWLVSVSGILVFAIINTLAWWLSRFLERRDLLRDRLRVVLRCAGC